MALAIFEPTQYTAELASSGIMTDEAELQKEWENEVRELLNASGLKVPEVSDPQQYYGGRTGEHSEHLPPLLKEMTEVFAIDTAAAW